MEKLFSLSLTKMYVGQLNFLHIFRPPLYITMYLLAVFTNMSITPEER